MPALSAYLYVIKHLTFVDVLRLAAEMLLGNWRGDEAIEIENVRHVSLRMKRSTIKAMIDGEIESLDVPLNFGIRPCALSVLAPAPAVDTDTDELLPVAPAAKA
jgi:diacylglycerol kinase family enzyme